MALFDLWGGKSISLTDTSFWKSFFGLTNYSNKTVTPDSALQLDAVWACAKLISETVGTLPCITYGKDGTTPAVEHPVYELLHDAPNADNTSVEFWEGMALAVLLYGNAFAEKKYNGTRLVALNILHPGAITIKREGTNNERVYYHAESATKRRRISEKNMFHVRGLSFGGDVGLSVVAFARNTLGAAIAAEETSGKMFANGMNVAGVLTSDQVLKPEQRKQLGETLAQYSGSEKAGKIAVLEAGLKYQQMTVNPQDAQMLQTRQFSVEQICRWFGVPPVMIGHSSNGTTTWGSGVEQLILQFTKTGLRPLLRRFEAAIRRDLFTPKERQNLSVKFNMEGLLRGDSETRANFLGQMVNNGIYTRNEARAYENKPPVEGGDDLTVQTSLTPIDQLARVTAPKKSNA